MNYAGFLLADRDVSPGFLVPFVFPVTTWRVVSFCDHGSAPKITGPGHPTQQALTPGSVAAAAVSTGPARLKKHINYKFRQQVHYSLLIGARPMCSEPFYFARKRILAPQNGL